MLRKRIVLGELEVRVLGVLWDRGPSTVTEILEALPEEETRHYNTVATVLRRLVDREIVSREREGRGYRFEAEVGREELARHYLGIVREELYGGSLSRLVAALLTPGGKSGKTEGRVAKLLEELAREEDPDGR